MFKKVLEYAGEYRKKTYLSVAVLLFGVVVSVLPYFFAYQLIVPLLGYGDMDAAGIIWHVAAIAACGPDHGGGGREHRAVRHSWELMEQEGIYRNFVTMRENSRGWSSLLYESGTGKKVSFISHSSSSVKMQNEQ